MEIQSVLFPAFREYGQIVSGYDFTDMLKALAETPKPAGETVYRQRDEALEALPVAAELRDRYFGGLPIEIGYCNGYNTRLIGLEYHRTSELNLVETDTVFLIAKQTEMTDGRLDGKKVRAFLCPAGTAVEMFATTLHFAPCDARTGDGFRCLVVLPAGTNTDLPPINRVTPEDAHLVARNKWLFLHESLPFVKSGKAPGGLYGELIDLARQLE